MAMELVHLNNYIVSLVFKHDFGHMSVTASFEAQSGNPIFDHLIEQLGPYRSAIKRRMLTSKSSNVWGLSA